MGKNSPLSQNGCFGPIYHENQYYYEYVLYVLFVLIV